MARLRFAGEVIKTAAACGVSRAPTGQRLPTAYGRIEMERIEFYTIASPAGAFGRDYRRAAAEKTVEHDVAAGGAVEDRVSDQRHRFDGRVQRQEVTLL